jgi:hypothetical protein
LNAGRDENIGKHMKAVSEITVDFVAVKVYAIYTPHGGEGYYISIIRKEEKDGEEISGNGHDLLCLPGQCGKKCPEAGGSSFRKCKSAYRQYDGGI